MIECQHRCKCNAFLTFRRHGCGKAPSFRLPMSGDSAANTEPAVPATAVGILVFAHEKSVLSGYTQQIIGPPLQRPCRIGGLSNGDIKTPDRSSRRHGG